MKRTRFIGILLTTFFILSLYTIFALIMSPVEGREEEKEIEVMVKEGDTFWSIAERYFSGKGDIRRYIYHIQKTNNREGGLLIPGERLRIVIID